MNKQCTSIAGAGSSLELGRKINAVVHWAIDRGIIEQGNGEAQAEKTIEEATELHDAIVAQDKEEVKDGIGDTLVTLIVQAQMQELTLLECLEHAYNEIKNRQGTMVGGTFVKDSKSWSYPQWIAPEDKENG